IIAKTLDKLLVLTLGHDYFSGLKALEKLVDIGCLSLGDQELARRNVEEGYPHLAFFKMDGRQVVVRLLLHDIVVIRHAWRYEFGDAPFHDGLGRLGIFQLVADGYALSR